MRVHHKPCSASSMAACRISDHGFVPSAVAPRRRRHRSGDPARVHPGSSGVSDRASRYTPKAWPGQSRENRATFCPLMRAQNRRADVPDAVCPAIVNATFPAHDRVAAVSSNAVRSSRTERLRRPSRSGRHYRSGAELPKPTLGRPSVTAVRPDYRRGGDEHRQLVAFVRHLGAIA